MSSETQARVFDPFFTTKSEGRGLGLAAVHGIVRNLGGAIHCASEPGKGTTFTIFLPSSEATADNSSYSTWGSREPASLPREFAVLVVEDEDPLRQAVVTMLRRNGFEVIEAANGTTAIDLLQAKDAKIDVMLLDMTIPGVSSREVALEAVKIRPDVKVVLTSAYSEDMVRANMSKASVPGFIRKPFQLVYLTQELWSVLSS
jgi:CheY-like chemotaxis protein